MLPGLEAHHDRRSPRRLEQIGRAQSTINRPSIFLSQVHLRHPVSTADARCRGEDASRNPRGEARARSRSDSNCRPLIDRQAGVAGILLAVLDWRQFLSALFTGQRQTDRLIMRNESGVEGGHASRHSKTGELVDIKEAPQLGARLNASRVRMKELKLRLRLESVPLELVVNDCSSTRTSTKCAPSE